MNLTELLLVTVMGFHGGRIGQMTLVEALARRMCDNHRTVEPGNA